MDFVFEELSWSCCFVASLRGSFGVPGHFESLMFAYSVIIKLDSITYENRNFLFNYALQMDAFLRIKKANGCLFFFFFKFSKQSRHTDSLTTNIFALQ